MSLVPIIKKCPKCKMKYSWNPDVGEGLFCPHCAGMGVPPKSTLESIWRKNKKKIKK